MMRSPFPGMDPYLEPHWLDVHGSLVIAGRNTLNERLPEDLIARSEERVDVEAEDADRRNIGPDVRMFEVVGATTAVAIETDIELAPYRLKSMSDPMIERHIEILDSTGQRLITVIEFLSPTNKSGKGLAKFLQKRDELLAGDVNVVEIDMNRSGDWRDLLSPHHCPRTAVATYRATIRIPAEPQTVYLHPIPLRQPLPAIKVPLRPQEKPIELPLQPLIEQAYHNGRYARTIDYSRQPDPPLEGDDANWVGELLRAAGKR